MIELKRGGGFISIHCSFSENIENVCRWSHTKISEKRDWQAFSLVQWEDSRYLSGWKSSTWDHDDTTYSSETNHNDLREKNEDLNKDFVLHKDRNLGDTYSQ